MTGLRVELAGVYSNRAWNITNLERFPEVLIERRIDDRIEGGVGVSQPQEDGVYPDGDGGLVEEGAYESKDEKR